MTWLDSAKSDNTIIELSDFIYHNIPKLIGHEVKDIEKCKRICAEIINDMGDELDTKDMIITLEKTLKVVLCEMVYRMLKDSEIDTLKKFQQDLK